MADKAGPAKKVSLFKSAPFAAPSFPGPQDSDDDDGENDFFSRSKHTYALIAADEEERRKRKKQEADAAKSSAESKKPIETPSPKKRKSSEAGLDATSPPGSQFSSAARSQKHARPFHSPSDLRSPSKPSPSTRHTRDLQRPTPPIIGIDSDDDDDDDDDDGDILITSASTQDPLNPSFEAPSGPSFSGTASGSDFLDSPHKNPRPSPRRPDADANAEFDDFDDFPLHPTPSPSKPLPDSAPSSALKPTSSAAAAAAAAALANEPKVSILITSSLPNATPLIVQRKLSQRLKEARLEWCHRQQFSAEETAKIVLTWRGKRVYDSTSCKGLGIGTDGQGNTVGEGEADLFGIEDKRIHMEAMTEEMLAKAKAARLKGRRGGSEDEEVPGGVGGAGAEAAPRPVEEKRLRIILRSVGLEELKFLVKPSESVARIVREFRDRRGVEEGRHIALHFDGEELEPDSTVGHCEIDDMDTLDVYVR